MYANIMTNRKDLGHTGQNAGLIIDLKLWLGGVK
jgi:hypothetical protein